MGPKQSKSSVTSTDTNAKISQIRDLGTKLSKNSRQHQNMIDKQKAQINSLQKNQNKQLRGLLDPKLLVNAISHAVTTSLKVNFQPQSKGATGNDGIGYVRKPYLGKP